MKFAMNRFVFFSKHVCCVCGLSLLLAGCDKKVAAPARPAARTRARTGHGGTGPRRQQFQGGPSRTVSAGDRRRTRRRAGIERDWGGQSRCFAAGAGAVAGYRAHRGNRRAAGRRGEEGPASVQSAQHRHRRRVFGLPPGRQERATDEDPTQSRQAPVRQRRRSQERTGNRAERRRRQPWSIWKPPPNTCACWAPIPAHPDRNRRGFAPVSGTITDQQITDQSGVQALWRRQLRSRFPTCRTSGSSATSRRTTWRRCMSANTPISI